MSGSRIPGPRHTSLRPAPPAAVLRLAALGDETALAKLLTLRLQAHDDQPGMSIPFMELDYDRVADWLDAILDLDPRAGYPLLAAARLYGSVPDPARQRVMFELVHRRFLEDPRPALAVARTCRGAREAPARGSRARPAIRPGPGRARDRPGSARLGARHERDHRGGRRRAGDGAGLRRRSAHRPPGTRIVSGPTGQGAARVFAGGLPAGRRGRE